MLEFKFYHLASSFLSLLVKADLVFLIMRSSDVEPGCGVLIGKRRTVSSVYA